MEYIVASSGVVRAAPSGSKIVGDIPVGIYNLGISPQGEPLLFPNREMTLPKVVFGDYNEKAERIISTFKHRNKSTGVFLSGLKGTGKTMLTRIISMNLLGAGHPIIIINGAIPVEIICDFIDAIETECVVIFDEYEKHFKDNDQEKMLGMLDGLHTSKKLFIITANNQHKVSSFIHNRPGRLFYHLRFNSIPKEEVIEYCNHYKLPAEHTKELVDLLPMIEDVSYDILQAIVEECLRYNESPTKAIKMLNVQPVMSDLRYVIKFIPSEGNENIESTHEELYVDFDDLSNGDVLDIDLTVRADGDGDDEIRTIELDPTPFIRRRENVTIKHELGTIMFSRQRRKGYSWGGLMGGTHNAY